MGSRQDPVLVVTPAERQPGPVTPGMDRQQAFATEKTWSGFARTEPGMVSGWHHHGEYESVIYVLTGALKMEFGPNGSNTVRRGRGISSTCRKVLFTGRAIRPQFLPTSSSCEQVWGSPQSTWMGRRQADGGRMPTGQPCEVGGAHV